MSINLHHGQFLVSSVKSFSYLPDEEFRIHRGTIKENRPHQQYPIYSHQMPIIKISKVTMYLQNNVRLHRIYF